MFDESILLQKLKNVSAGSINDFDFIYEATKGLLYKTIYVLIQDHHTAEDLLHETYLKILHHDWLSKEKHNVISFMITVAKNLTFNEMKKKSRYVVIDTIENEDLFKSHDYSQDSSLLKILPSILKKDELLIFSLHVFENMTHKEIASILKKPLGTITWKYQQTIKKLQRKVGKLNG